MDKTDRPGPDDVSVGDEVRFTYGPKDRKSRKAVQEVREFNIKVEGGGMVSYRDIVDIIPQDDPETEESP